MPNVTVNSPSVIQVKVGNATNPQATAINYGSQSNNLIKLDLKRNHLRVVFLFP